MSRVALVQKYRYEYSEYIVPPDLFQWTVSLMYLVALKILNLQLNLPQNFTPRLDILGIFSQV